MLACWPLLAQQRQDLAAGQLLVATRKSHDPELAQSVVVLIHYDEQGAVGLIVNHPSKVPLSQVFPELTAAKARSEPAYSGGPVILGVRGLLRSKTKPEKAEHLFADVYVTASKALLEKTIAAGAPPSAFRVYVGYTGWSQQQLKNEVGLGLWRIIRGDAGVVFDPNPLAVWTRLTGRATGSLR